MAISLKLPLFQYLIENSSRSVSCYTQREFYSGVLQSFAKLKPFTLRRKKTTKTFSVDSAQTPPESESESSEKRKIDYDQNIWKAESNSSAGLKPMNSNENKVRNGLGFLSLSEFDVVWK